MATGPYVQGEDQLFSVYIDTTWFVVFGEREKPLSWWDKLFTRPQFRHCWAFARLTGDRFIAVDSMSGGLQIREYHNDILQDHGFADLIDFCLSEGDLVIPANGVQNQDYIARLSPMTCVEVVKHLLGIDNIFILTPYQLYRYIVKNRLNMFEYKKIINCEN